MIEVKNKKRNPFIMLEKDLILGIKDANAFLIYSILSCFENYQDKKSKLSFDSLVEKSGLSKPTINKAIRFLQKNGYIVIEKIKNKNGFFKNEYHLLNPNDISFAPTSQTPSCETLPPEAYPADLPDLPIGGTDEVAPLNYPVSEDDYPDGGSHETPHTTWSPSDDIPNMGDGLHLPSSADLSGGKPMPVPSSPGIASGGVGGIPLSVKAMELENLAKATMNNLRGIPDEKFDDGVERAKQLAKFREYMRQGA